MRSSKKKQRIFFDMDGTTAYWRVRVTPEDVKRRGYFLGLKPMMNMIAFVKLLCRREEYEVYILSTVYDGKRFRDEKNIWLNKYIPYIPKRRRIFVPSGITKSEYVEQITGRKEDTDILIDDHTNNLLNWHGIAIKAYNGVNGNGTAWSGPGIRAYLDEIDIYQDFTNAKNPCHE